MYSLRTLAGFFVIGRGMEGPLQTNGNWRELALDGVVGEFWTKIVVGDGPRGDGPTIIYLPQQGSSAIFSTRPLPLSPPEPKSSTQALSLHELSTIDELFKRLKFVLHVFDKVKSYSSLMAHGLVMEVYSRGL